MLLLSLLCLSFVFLDIPIFGPTAAAAQIEADKAFAKQFMVRHGIPTAKFQNFTDPEKACEYITR